MDRYPGERDRLQALFVKYNVELVSTGHEHLYERKSVDGVTHIITGGGGAPLYADEKDGGFNHFIVVTVDGDKVSAEVVDGNNKVRDRF
jgi:predicted phosphodiesterase